MCLTSTGGALRADHGRLQGKKKTALMRGVKAMGGNYPEWHEKLRQEYPEYMEALEHLGKTVRKEGPLDEKASQLIQLGAAAAIGSEGAVHSHTRRALEAGATREQICHAVVLLTSTIGFPAVAAALSWVHDIVGDKK
ncbi:MAG: carboxymuconolactone decarboxylase family protein [Syntrophobacteraceae bacterium]